MIDSHVHLRDWDWKHKETLEHGLRVADAIDFVPGKYTRDKTGKKVAI